MLGSTIYIIEDNLDFASILLTMLSMLGYQTQHYETLSLGRAAIASAMPALLVLDGQLPDGEGIELYMQLRAQPATQRLPILLLSVSDDVHQQARSAARSDPQLVVGLKPMPIDEIEATVARLLRQP